MIPLVLKRIAEAINKKDYEQLDELMTPYLSRLYKHAIANLSAQGYRIHLEVDVQESGVKKEYAQFKAGDPEAFDNTIPYKTRREGYSILNSEYMSIAFKRDRTTKEVKKLKFNTSLFHDWCAFEYGFVASANVKVNLRKGSRVVDSESGVMQIPISISTPHYFGTLGMINAVSGNEEAMAEEPFRWRVCDLFYIADWNNANSAAKESKYNP
ncbi:hypothetical protein GGI11_004017 [Coemansia sp. RSA 2049]|nr:hypothetical protein GGI11_004017 [Coemansia sp. RSA 2049]